MIKVKVAGSSHSQELEAFDQSFGSVVERLCLTQQWTASPTLGVPLDTVDLHHGPLVTKVRVLDTRK
jgi:hypothetical protein